MLDSAAARRVRLLGLDVDGVLTDNGVYLGLAGGEKVEFKRFDIQDGLGLDVARELGIEEVIQDSRARKLPAVEALRARLGLSWDEIAFVGDDLADLPILRRVGVPIAVANAVDEVKRIASFVTAAPGGQGAVREAIEILFRARGEWDEGVRRYLRERDSGVEPVAG
jgi:3-deoxy-D-manno-octulosonate 8-phosphate phosphatase (KDO 8-P phosphatase)